jgi:putative oxidoreductase
MKIVKQIPAFLLAFLFLFGGLNHFFNFVPNPPMTGEPLAFMELFGKSGYMTVIKICEVLFGLLLLIPKTRALGYILIAPIAVNILIFELHIAHAPGIGIALVALTALGIYFNKEKYMGILS